MRRLAALAWIVMSVSWNLTYLSAVRADDDGYRQDPAAKFATKTPIKHLVVIFDENIPFDHYFGTYPNAKPNMDGSVYFGKPKDDTPAVNGYTPTLLSNNPNLLTGGGNPFRLDRSQASTCNPSNAYTKEQEAYDGGLVDKYAITNPAASGTCSIPFLSMGYYDGNTVTALWNYAQNYAMSDNDFDTEFGVTVEGHMNLLSGQTHGLQTLVGNCGSPAPGTCASPKTDTNSYAGTINNGTIIANVEPFYDDCGDNSSGTPPQVVMTGKNVGNLLNSASVSWGWFYGDFSPVTTSGGVASCITQYNPHYAPFDYYQSTANPHHITQTILSKVGTDTCGDFSCPNHNYDLTTFYNAIAAGNLPAVTFLKFAENATGHASDSTPLEEQTALVTAVNAIEQSPFWKDTAIILTYDDTGGWYDHVAGPIVSYSQDPTADAITGTPKASLGTGSCGNPLPAFAPVIQDRCGFGVRMPLLVISPYAKRNYVDHSLNDSTSILRFIEYNWSLGTIGDPQSFDVLASGTVLGMFDFDDNHGDDRSAESRKVILDPTYGVVVGPEGGPWH
jgi:phospholipase C